uniref:Uncharacterized protein n=1 Tax=Musca domestica TaxID=7370 RepID=A0A1I8NL23_MUSDO
MSVKIYSEEELLNVDDGFDYTEPRPTDPQAGMSSAAVEAALVEPIAAVKISERGSESDKADSSAALAEPMQTESESISVDSSAAPVPADNPKLVKSRTESGSSGPSAAPVATPHLEESEKNLKSETHKVASAA